MSHRPRRSVGSRVAAPVFACIAAALLVLVTAVGGRKTARSETATGSHQASDSAAAIAVVRRFSELLVAGDSLAALALLTADAVVLESGSVETRAEYRSHHLPADIEYARAVRSEHTVRRVSVRGDVAWVSSGSATRGEFRGRPVNSVGAELMVLVRTPAGWKISAIHWSSRSRRS